MLGLKAILLLLYISPSLSGPSRPSQLTAKQRAGFLRMSAFISLKNYGREVGELPKWMVERDSLCCCTSLMGVLNNTL